MSYSLQLDILFIFIINITVIHYGSIFWELAWEYGNPTRRI